MTAVASTETLDVLIQGKDTFRGLLRLAIRAGDVQRLNLPGDEAERALADAAGLLLDSLAVASPLYRAAAAERDRLREALTPSSDTKAVYNGEFTFPIEYTDADGDPQTEDVMVPWTTVKDVMAMIRRRADAPKLDLEEAAEKAALWDGLMNMARLRPLGWAGMDGKTGLPEDLDFYGNPNAGYAHLGLELWTAYPDFSTNEAECASHERGKRLLACMARLSATRAGGPS